MAVSANQLLHMSEGDRGGGPVAASTNLYEGTIAYWNSSGYLDDDTASGANKFAGIVATQADNSSGSNGAINADLWLEGTFKLTGSGFSQATVGQDIYASDNYTITTSATGNVKIGKCVEYVDSTHVLVKLLHA